MPPKSASREPRTEWVGAPIFHATSAAGWTKRWGLLSIPTPTQHRQPRVTAYNSTTHGRCRGGQPGQTEDVLHTPASAETAIEDMLARQVDFNEIEDFIELLPISEEHRSALWLWAWSSQPPRRLDAIQLKKHAGSR